MICGLQAKAEVHRLKVTKVVTPEGNGIVWFHMMIFHTGFWYFMILVSMSWASYYGTIYFGKNPQVQWVSEKRISSRSQQVCHWIAARRPSTKHWDKGWKLSSETAGLLSMTSLCFFKFLKQDSGIPDKIARVHTKKQHFISRRLQPEFCLLKEGHGSPSRPKFFRSLCIKLAINHPFCIPKKLLCVLIFFKGIQDLAGIHMLTLHSWRVCLRTSDWNERWFLCVFPRNWFGDVWRLSKKSCKLLCKS